MNRSRKGSEQAKDKAVDSQLTAQGKAVDKRRTGSGTSIHRHEVQRPVQPAREGRDVDIERELPAVQDADMGHRSDSRPQPIQCALMRTSWRAAAERAVAASSRLLEKSDSLW